MAKKIMDIILKRFLIFIGSAFFLSIPLYYYFIMKVIGGRFQPVLRNQLLFFLALSFLIFVGLFLITKNFLQFLIKEIRLMLQVVSTFSVSENTAPQFKKMDITELMETVRVLEYRMNLNLAIYNAQQEFVENAAHELQTPLAIFQAKIDLLIQDPLIRERQFEILNLLNENVSRMKRLNRNLLFLSQMNHQDYEGLEKIGLNDLIAKQVDFFKEQGLAKGLHFTINLNISLEVTANLALTEILIQNLFMNAIRHNVEGGEVVVSTTERGFILSNTGRKALQEEKIFNRFYKSDSSETGTGLGLSIVKKVVDINHWDIQYSYNNSTHNFFVRVK